MTTEELIKLIGDETERYWKLSNKLTVRQSYKTEGRKDLEKLKECHRLWSEVLSRPSEEYLKAQVLLSDPRPGVRLSAATELPSSSPLKNLRSAIWDLMATRTRMVPTPEGG